MKPFQFTTCRCSLTTPAVSTNQNRKRVCIFLCHETVAKSNNRSRSFSLHPTVQFDVLHQLLDLRHKQHTNFCKTACPESSCSCFCRLVGFILLWGTSASQGTSSSSFPIPTSSRGASIGSMSSPIGARSNLIVFVGLTSALLCHTHFPTAEICSHY